MCLLLIVHFTLTLLTVSAIRHLMTPRKNTKIIPRNSIYFILMALCADLPSLAQKLMSFQDKEPAPSPQPKSPAPVKTSNPLLSPPFQDKEPAPSPQPKSTAPLKPSNTLLPPVRPPPQSSSTKLSPQPSTVKPSLQLHAKPNNNNHGVC